MTEKQKKAIRLINSLRYNQKTLSEEEYFILFDFIVSEQPQVTWIPYNPYYYKDTTTTNPFVPYKDTTTIT